MRVFLDTHTLIWLVMGDKRVSPPALQAFQEAREVVWSTVSLWEIAIKLSLEKDNFQLRPDWMEIIIREMKLAGAKQIGITDDHCKILASLPWHHRDPFDRMLICQALHDDLMVITADRRFKDYDLTILW